MNYLERNFESFSNKRRNGKLNSINEAVVKRDDTFIVGGINVPQKAINAYVRKVKEQTGKDLKSMFSEMEIAQELVLWSVGSLDNVDNIPVSALLGGDEEMGEDISMDMEDEVVDDEGLDIDSEISDEEGGEADLDLEADLEEGGEEDNFESPDLDEEPSDEDIVDETDDEADDEIDLDIDDVDLEDETDEDETDEEELDLPV